MELVKPYAGRVCLRCAEPYEPSDYHRCQLGFGNLRVAAPLSIEHFYEMADNGHSQPMLFDMVRYFFGEVGVRLLRKHIPHSACARPANRRF
jgi:hypothetical protein